jgi:oligoribonuclease
MTGLDPNVDTILEIFCIVTDYELNVLDEAGFSAVIHHDQEALDRMNEWCIKTHGESGLSQRVLDSSTTPGEAAAGLLAYIKRFVPNHRGALLAGNSVHADRSFLVVPPYNTVTDHLHYRIFDISSMKEAVKRWAPEILVNFPHKKYLHQAREDILESIAEAKFYRDTIFAPLRVASSLSK